MRKLTQICRCATYFNKRTYYSLIPTTMKSDAIAKTDKCNNRNITTGMIKSSINYFQETRFFKMYSNMRFLSLSHSSFAKNRDKGKDKKKKAGVVQIDETEMAEFIDIDKYKSNLNRTLDALKNDLVKNISVRSSIGSIEDIKIKMDDKTYTVQELAQISRKPKMVVLNCATFPQAIKQVIDALNNSGMNLNPQQEGTTIYVPTPKVTKDHREQLAKNAKMLFVRYRDELKDIQNKQLKNIKNNSKISLDAARRLEEQVKALCQKYVSEIEKLVENKQKELLGE